MIPTTEEKNTQLSENIPDRRRSYLKWDKENFDNNQNYLIGLVKSISPNFEFLLANCLTAILLVIAFLTDQQPIYIFAIIIAPIYYSIIGFSFGLNLGAFTFIKTALLSWLETFFIIGLSGIFAGYIAKQFSGIAFVYWREYIGLSWANFVLIAVGVIFLITIFVRNPKSKSFVVNVALSYCLILPLSAAGFALGFGNFSFFLTGIKSFFIMVGTAILIGIVTLLISGIRPQIKKLWSPVLAIVIILSGLMFFLVPGNLEIPFEKIIGAEFNKEGLYLEPTPTKVVLLSKTADATLPKITMRDENAMVSATLIPTIPATMTPTITLTPLPTPVWAEIQAGEANGANIRSDPGFSGKIILSVLNGTLVEILPDVAIEDGITWSKIKFPDQTEGWIVRSLLLSATPAPEW